MSASFFCRAYYTDSTYVTDALVSILRLAVKFENIMWESNGSDQIKVIDFGLSKYSASGEKYMHEGVGTIYTMAPQVLQGVCK